VRRVADGLRDKRSARAQKLLPAGALLWAWDADPEYGEEAGEEWLVLLPKKWNKHLQYGWRFDACELRAQGAQGAQGGAERPVRAPRVDMCETDVESSDDEMEE
jgi:hypothetical protein